MIWDVQFSCPYLVDIHRYPMYRPRSWLRYPRCSDQALRPVECHNLCSQEDWHAWWLGLESVWGLDGRTRSEQLMVYHGLSISC